MSARHPYITHHYPLPGVPGTVASPPLPTSSSLHAYRPSPTLPSSSSSSSAIGSSSVGVSTEPIEDPKCDYIIYYRDDVDGRGVVEFAKNKSGLGAQVAYHDVAWIEANPSKYSWFARRGVKGTPSVYERKTGRVHSGGITALAFLETEAKNHLERQRMSRPPISSHISSPASTDPSRGAGFPASGTWQEVIMRLDDLKEQLSRKAIEDAAFQAKLLSHMSKSSTSLHSAIQARAAASGNVPREVSLGSSKLATYDSHSPPSSPTGPDKQRVKIERGPGKIMAPLHVFPKTEESSSTRTLSEEEKKKREKELEKKEMERKQDVDVWRRICDDGEDPVVFIEDESTHPSTPRMREEKKEMKRADMRDMRERDTRDIRERRDTISW